MSKVTINNPQDFDMDEYPFILLSKTITMVSPNKPVYFLSFVKDNKKIWEHPNVRINMERMEIEEKERVYKVIEDYLAKHPEKHIRFDGCCFHYPRSS